MSDEFDPARIVAESADHAGERYCLDCLAWGDHTWEFHLGDSLFGRRTPA